MSDFEEKETGTHFEGIIPVFRVKDLKASIDYYVKVLGFKVDWQHDYFASVGRDRCNIFLSQGDQGHPGSWAWVGINDADAVFEEFRASGAHIRQPPTNFQWAYEMQVADLDGNVLRLGSDPKPGEPFGPWLDMNGKLWLSKDSDWAQAEAGQQDPS